MKRVAALLGLAGLALAIGLIAWRGVDQVVAALIAAGWGLALVVLWEIVPLAVDSIGWRVLIARAERPGFAAMVRARWIRQSVNQLLPVAQIGGELVGARILMLGGVSGPVAGASVVVDLTLGVLTQVVYTLICVALLASVDGGGGLALAVVAGTGVLLGAIAAFFLAQRRGLFGWIARTAQSLSGRGWLALVGGGEALDRAVRTLYRRPRALWGNAAWQMAAWTLGAGEVWIALHVLGHPVGLVESLIIQGLGRAARSAAFAVPAGIGVQEGGYMLICGTLGLGPDIGLALSLVKRVRELGVGLPGLLAWQAAEGRRWWRGRAAGESG
ncbi:MAG: lysylphosphatidylglycerol synthase domain-containing protein [Alphaproteobacteria bacterium]|nr:lysylphosphatidylglycerol synthase domain-containing protein [Alphaproteobacteria bacterium]